MLRQLPIVTVIGMVLFSTSFAWSQNQTGGNTGTTGGTTGSTSSRTTGATGTTGTTGAAGTTGTQSMGTGGTGGNGGGQLQTASPVGNEPTFNAGDGTLGDQVGQGFTGRQNTGFVGNRNAATSNRNSSLQQMLSNFGAMGQDPNANSSTTNRNNVKRARPQQRIAFTYPRVNLTQAQVDVSDRIGRLAKVRGGTASISDQGVATLTGTVASEDDRKLAEAMARLEPGVRSVKNELQVAPAAAP